MLTTVEIEMSHAAALASEDHFVLVLDEVHAAGIGVDEERSVTASSETTGTRLRDDDVRDAFGIWTLRVRKRTTAPATTARSTSTPAATSPCRHSG
jgi:hypothetical protein